MKPVNSVRSWGLALGATLVLLVGLSVAVGRTEALSPGEALRGIAGAFGVDTSLSARVQAIAELRLWRVLTAAGVGASLALAGALLQGVFRNGLAAPSVIGVTAGASLGAAVAILILGGYAPLLLVHGERLFAPVLVAIFAFLGAAGAAFLVIVLARRAGRLSVPALLLMGIAVNACLAGVLAGIQAFTLEDYEIARAIIAWTFGSLDDKSSTHVILIGTSTLLVASVVPFVARELDLFVAGEDDARSLGVNTQRVKVLAVCASALGAATAASVAGQIAFVGLIVPHMIRLLVGTSHRVVLPLSLLGGAVFLTGTEFVQLAALGDSALRPGVVMSLIGGPLFVVLLLRHGDLVRTW